MTGLMLVVLVLKSFHLVRAASCSDLVTSASCTAESGCSWTSTESGSCRAPTAADCTLSSCSTSLCIHGDTRCEDKDSITCGAKDNSMECVNEQTTDCEWGYTDTGLCQEAVCSTHGPCADEFGDSGPCLETGTSSCNTIVYTDEYCTSLATGVPCTVFSNGVCVVREGSCVGADSENDEMCAQLPVSAMGCDTIVSMTKGACKNDGGCKADSTHTPYACKLEDGGSYCDAASVASGDCESIPPACNPRTGTCSGTHRDTCLYTSGCTFYPDREYCFSTGKIFDCSGATVVSADGCSAFNSECGYIEASCTPKTPLSCSPSNTACSASQISIGCVSTAEVGTCGEKNGSVLVTYAPLSLLLLILALLL